MTRRKITLKRGEELLINGFVVRAIGPDPKKPDSLSLCHPNVYNIIESKQTPAKHLYAGICETVVCASTICVGTVGSLASIAADTNKAVQSARAYLAAKA